MAKSKKKQTRRKQRQAEIYELDPANIAAIKEGPKRKKWNERDIKNIKPYNERQHEMCSCFFQGSHICAVGSAGTGKSYLAMYLAMRDILDYNLPQAQLKIVRSAVQTREQGHLPGTLEDKMAPYELPYKDILGDLFGRESTYENMKDAGLIEFMTTSFIRGLTWDDSIVIIDEVQNMTFHEIHSVITRLGKNSKIIILGDFMQNDLTRRNSDKTGILELLKVVNTMDEFSVIEFQTEDIVRSEFVKEWILSCNEVLDL